MKLAKQSKAPRFFAIAIIVFLVGLSVGASAQINRQKVPKGSFSIIEGVSINNGNFSLTLQQFTGGTGIPYRQTYNSKSVNRSRFGKGWGSIFDTRLVLFPDDTAVIVENGNGALTRYGNNVTSKTSASRLIALRENEIKYRDTPGAVDISGILERQEELSRSLEKLVAAAEKINLPTSIPADQALFVSGALEDETCFQASIRRLSNPENFVIYIRQRCNGVVQGFDSRGRLLGFLAGAPTEPTLSWGSVELKSIRDNEGHLLTLNYNPRKTTVTDENGNWITYSFDERGNTDQINGKIISRMSFAYDQRSNMKLVTFADTTTISILYDENDRATSVIDREGNVTTFAYRHRADGVDETEIHRRSQTGSESAVVYEFE